MLCCLLVLVAACSSRVAPPAADAGQRAFPDIGGAHVMLLPVQRIIPAIASTSTADTSRPMEALAPDALGALEAELAYWLPEHAQRTRWVLPEAVERAARGSAALEMNVRDLPVSDFRHSSLRWIGDPLYGDLRRIALVTDARLAMIPIGAVWMYEAGGLGRVHVAAALIDTMGGGVLWYGVAAGAPAASPDHAALASAAQALAALVPR